MIEKKDKFFINAIVFDENPIMIIEQYNIDNLFFDKLLTLLNYFIENYNSMQSFDDYMVKNILDIINYIKCNYKYDSAIDKKNKYDIYNNAIISLNNSLQVNSEYFYISNGLARGILSGYDYKFNNFFVPKNIKQIIRTSLCYDNFFYDILTKERKNVSDSEISILVMNELFIYSVNYFRLECPKILENNSILKQVLIENKKFLFEFKNLDDKDFYTLKNLKKSSKKLLKEIR